MRFIIATIFLAFMVLSCNGILDGSVDDPQTETDEPEDDTENGEDTVAEDDAENGEESAAVRLFQMSPDAVWVYAVRVASQDAWGQSVDTTVDVGVITVKIVDFDPSTRIGRLSVG